MATPKKQFIESSSIPATMKVADSGKVPDDKQVDLPPVQVIPLSDQRDDDGDWVLVLPPTSAASKAIKSLTNQREDGVIQLPDELIEALAKSAVDPIGLARALVERQRVDDGWFSVITTRLFTPMIDVSLANDRWVADAVYAADPATKGTAAGKYAAVPMPQSHPSYSAIVYDSDVSALVNAAEVNFKMVLTQNRQEVGRRLIEQPVTLAPTIIDGEDGEHYFWTTADGNCRASSALDRLKVPVEWLPPELRDSQTFKSMSPGQLVQLTPTVLMNLSLAAKRTVTRKIAKHASDRLKVTAKVPGAKGYARDLAERDAAAAAINALTVPARVIVGWSDDDAVKGTTRFAPAVRALLVQMNVEGKPLEVAAREAVRAEEIVTDLHDEGVVGDDLRDVLLGRLEQAAPMAAIGLASNLPDLRAAQVVRTLTAGDQHTRRIMRQRLRGEKTLHPQHRNFPIIELCLRSYTATLEDRLVQVRRALESGLVWPELVSKDWSVYDVDTDDKVDELVQLAVSQVDTGGPAARLLGVLGLFALTTSGHLIAPGASAKELVGGAEIDRGPVGLIVSRLCAHTWGLELLGDAIKRVRAAKSPRTINDDGDLVEQPGDWSPADYNAHLRLTVKKGATTPLVIPGSAAENLAWNKVVMSVVDARERMLDFLQARSDAGTTDKLDWSDAEATMKGLRSMASVLSQLTIEPLGAEFNL